MNTQKENKRLKITVHHCHTLYQCTTQTQIGLRIGNSNNIISHNKNKAFQLSLYTIRRQPENLKDRIVYNFEGISTPRTTHHRQIPILIVFLRKRKRQTMGLATKPCSKMCVCVATTCARELPGQRSSEHWHKICKTRSARNPPPQNLWNNWIKAQKWGGHPINSQVAIFLTLKTAKSGHPLSNS